LLQDFGLHFKLCIKKTKDLFLGINFKVIKYPGDQNYIGTLERTNPLGLQHDINNNVDLVYF